MKIFLLNDTGTVPHVGCQAVSDAHARLLGSAGHQVIDRAFLGELRSFSSAKEEAGIDKVLANEELRSRIEACDALVVNGEGTLHHGFGTEYFACLGAAQRLGKATLIVNSVFEEHKGWSETLKNLDDFCVRDAEFLRHATSHGFNARIVPDSFLAAQFDGDSIIDLNEKIVVTDWHPQRDADVGSTLQSILRNVDGSFFYPLEHGMHTHLWRSAVADWSNAGLIITARHHGVYMAARAGKPFVAMPSNTRKIEGLIEASGAKIPVVVDVSDIEEAANYAHQNLGEYERLFDWFNAHVPLSTFRVLGGSPANPAGELKRLEDQVRGKHLGRDTKFWGLGRG